MGGRSKVQRKVTINNRSLYLGCGETPGIILEQDRHSLGKSHTLMHTCAHAYTSPDTWTYLLPSLLICLTSACTMNELMYQSQTPSTMHPQNTRTETRLILLKLELNRHTIHSLLTDCKWKTAMRLPRLALSGLKPLLLSSGVAMLEDAFG